VERDLGAEPPWASFSHAVEVYRARFGPEHLPHLIDVDVEIATRVLRRAVERGRPVRGYLISRLSGSWRGPPPPGVFI
jgi:hypothetical protein